MNFIICSLRLKPCTYILFEKMLKILFYDDFIFSHFSEFEVKLGFDKRHVAPPDWSTRLHHSPCHYQLWPDDTCHLPVSPHYLTGLQLCFEGKRLPLDLATWRNLTPYLNLLVCATSPPSGTRLPCVLNPHPRNP